MLVVDNRHTLADPARLHLLRRCRPHLEVVGRLKVLRDAGTEHRLHPFLEVQLDAPARRAGKPRQALLGDLRRQVAQIVLKRIWHPAIAEPYVGRAVVMLQLIPHRLLK